jgi:alpha-D-ribose 1-methylphosphonate 5-triphosphate synthase subunit PhnL
MGNILRIAGLAKTFRLHNQDGAELRVLNDIDLAAAAGECVVLSGPSGAGKSTLLRCVYGNYLASAGDILVRHEGEMVDVTKATHRAILAMRRRTVGYVSQFLRAIPRVSTLDVVAEPLLRLGLEHGAARARAGTLLERLSVPSRMWALAPQTFSGGEQQRVNLARAFAVEYPILLLDEPTASLDVENGERVADLIDEARHRGAAILGVFHNMELGRRVGTRFFPMTPATESV